LGTEQISARILGTEADNLGSRWLGSELDQWGARSISELEELGNKQENTGNGDGGGRRQGMAAAANPSLP
jgi:hypothetical protein